MRAITTIVPQTTTCHDKDGVAFTVREYRPGDRPELDDFYAAFEPKRAAQGLPPPDAKRVSRWLDGVLDSGIHHLAFRDGELIGHGLVMPTHRDGVGEYAVFLRADLRGRGVGTELNRTVVEAAKKRALDGLWLSVEPDNRAAIRSYEKVGFRFVPRTLLSTEVEMELSF